MKIDPAAIMAQARDAARFNAQMSELAASVSRALAERKEAALLRVLAEHKLTIEEARPRLAREIGAGGQGDAGSRERVLLDGKPATGWIAVRISGGVASVYEDPLEAEPAVG